MDNFEIAEKICDHMGFENICNFGGEHDCYIKPDEVEDEELKTLLTKAQKALQEVYDYLNPFDRINRVYIHDTVIVDGREYSFVKHEEKTWMVTLVTKDGKFLENFYHSPNGWIEHLKLLSKAHKIEVK
jgi:hypothetical protein